MSLEPRAAQQPSAYPIPLLAWARWFRLRQRLKGSLWLVPLLGGGIGLLLAELDIRLEGAVSLPAEWRYDADTAAGALTAIVGAMVGLFGFVVTISVLVVQMATGTLSPRFMRLWYRDRLQKLVLATFLATVTFAFYLLRRVTDDSVPDLGVTLAGLGFGGSLILLLLYLDRFVHTLRPVGVAAKVARQGLREASRSLSAAPRHSRTVNPMAAATPSVVVGLKGAGAVLAINVRGLVALSAGSDCVVVLRCSVGDFVQDSAPVLEVYAGDRRPDPRALVGMIALGAERSIEDDPGFALRIMVDIATRALSPAVNDPTTAVQQLNYIDLLVRGLAPHLDGQRHIVYSDDAGAVRVVVPARAFEDYLALAVAEIIAYGGSSPQVCRRLTSMLRSLGDVVGPSCLPAVRSALASVERAVAAHFPEEERAFALRADRQGIGGPGDEPGYGLRK